MGSSARTLTQRGVGLGKEAGERGGEGRGGGALRCEWAPGSKERMRCATVTRPPRPIDKQHSQRSALPSAQPQAHSAPLVLRHIPDASPSRRSLGQREALAGSMRTAKAAGERPSHHRARSKAIACNHERTTRSWQFPSQRPFPPRQQCHPRAAAHLPSPQQPTKTKDSPLFRRGQNHTKARP